MVKDKDDGGSGMRKEIGGIIGVDGEEREERGRREAVRGWEGGRGSGGMENRSRNPTIYLFLLHAR